MRREGGWHVYTLGGLVEWDPGAPVAHVSYFEADAYARWAGRRLPREGEWEAAYREGSTGDANLAESGWFVPVGSGNDASGLTQMIGDVWEWTESAYHPYPGYRPAGGALGEYNGKFMSGQQVLRGGSCVTPRTHIRATYRNFFPPEARWQFSGIRLADDAHE
jgi:ergothioneine biosynthesis protein EgtB